VSLEVGASVCFYISTTPIWPYPNGVNQSNAAIAQCSSIGLQLATVENIYEHTLIKDLTRKYKF